MSIKIFLIKIKIIFISILILINKEKIIFIEINNEMPLYENNMDFSNFTSDIKAIAFFLPQFHSIKENDKWWGKGFTEWTNVKKSRPLFEGHYQPRIPIEKKKYLGYYKLTNPKILKKQVELAKSHGIYGFGFYYYWFSGKTLLEKPLLIFLKNKDIIFKFLLIWANENWTRTWDGKEKNILIKQSYNKNDPSKFIKDIKKYIIDKRYIKIDKKPVIGIYEPTKILNLNETIFIWREKAKEYGIGEIYILVSLNNHHIEEFNSKQLFNGIYQFFPRDPFFESKFIYNSQYYCYLYTSILYNEINLTNFKHNFHIFRSSMMGFDNSPRRKKPSIFINYSPKQFYMLNKKISLWTKEKYKNNKYIFINAWNEWGEGTYLEPDKKYGYANLNALSKAIFNISYSNSYYKLENLKNKSQIAIQAHLYSEFLINDIINKTNNIPTKFDLFISINLSNKSININFINNYIKNYSKANSYEIKLYNNKGNDFLPFLNQLKNKIKSYKYICHVHTMKDNCSVFFKEWRNFLYNNLLGNKDIISEILNDFETIDKLGIVFPEIYYKVFQNKIIEITHKDIYYMNYLINKLFKINLFISFRVGKRIDFPLENMFWAKTNSIYQIFNLKKKYIIGNHQKNKIFNAIQKIWIYIIQFNGFYYKKIFNHF